MAGSGFEWIRGQKYINQKTFGDDRFAAFSTELNIRLDMSLHVI